MSKLVIVESPNKIKSIEKYLGSEYVVMASVGHIVKLPSSGEHRFGVEMSTWTPNYKIDKTKKEVVQKLKEVAKDASLIYIATDPDREGEAIGENLVHFLKIKEKYKRIRFNEITESAIKSAINDPSEIDQSLVNSQIARRILDRIIGYKLSSLMRSKIANAPTSPSAGRVQSVALKIIVEREKLIDAFEPVPYFNVKAKIGDDVFVNYFNPDNKKDKEWIDPSDIKHVQAQFKGSLVVESVKVKLRKHNKKTPFKQSILYKRADSVLGISSTSVQSAAQKLYEGYGDGGLITYPRTDSTRMSSSFVNSAKEYIRGKYGDEYVADEIKGIAGKQDAHEAIRPTSLKLTPEDARNKFNLSTQEFQVYKLIYNNTIQSLMTVPQSEIINYILKEGDNLFRISSSKVVFLGYYKSTGYEKSKELPKYKEGDTIKVLDYDIESKETQPPSRFSEGSLIETLDEIGVGRPSTFATTIRILKNRGYADKDGKALVPSDFGKLVNEKLMTSFSDILNEKYTSKMESQLDKVAEDEEDYKKLLDDFWYQFQKRFETATITLDRTRMQDIPAGKICPKCGSELVVRRNKRDNTKFFACSSFPECRHTESDPSQKRKFFRRKK